MSNDVIGFYKGAATNQVGMTIQDVQQMDATQLEEDHHYIQWIFPLPEKSLAVPTSPVLRQADIDEFRGDIGLRSTMLRMALKMFDFYGLECGGGESYGKIVKADDFDEKAQNWLTPRNHNFLRMSRLLRSMKLLGLEGLAKNLHKCLCGIYEENKITIGEITKQFWDEAIEKDV